MKFLCAVFVAAVAVLPVHVARAQPKVVASIKPIHSLVAAVMQGVGESGIVVDGAASPHAYSLKPSQARLLEQAQVIFWVGPGLETFLEKPISSLAERADVVELSEAPGLVRLALREGGAFEPHGGHDEHDAHDEHETHAQDDHEHGSGHDHEKAEESGHDAFDSHLWLDPENAKAFVQVIEARLAAADPANADAYAANAKTVTQRLEALSADITELVRPVKDRPYIVFHDAYHYFENRFDLNAAGSITINPETPPGAGRVAEMHAKVTALGATCVFSEPQFEPKLIAVVTADSQARPGVLDPLGASLANGPDLYFTMMRALATAVRACLSPAG